VAWLSGLLEGEGYFGLIQSKVKGKTYRYARVGLSMTDRDVVERAAALMHASVISLKPTATSVSRLPFFRAHVIGRRAVSLMMVLRPHLGVRRQAQIDKVLAYEATRLDPNEARRRWSSAAAKRRHRDARGRLT
jgi:hypothetical protein